MRIPREVPVGLLISTLMFAAIFLVMRWRPLAGGSAFGKGLATSALMLLLSALAMATLGGGEWRAFGFRAAEQPWGRWVGFGLLAGTLATLAIQLSHAKGMAGALKGANPAQVLLLLLVASVAEECFVRGWLQGFLEPLRVRLLALGPLSVSLPVLTGALFFGAMHIPALVRTDLRTLVFILAFTTTLGLLAGLARERTGSLLPAVAVHLAGNVGGILGTLLSLALQRHP